MIGTISFLGGLFIGGLLFTYLFSLLTGRVFFREYEPESKARWAVMSGWLICGTLGAFGFGNGGFHFFAYFYYIPGAFAAFLLYRRSLRKAWDENQDFSTFN